MKKLIIMSHLFIVLLSSCATQKMATYNDDVYANPTEDRQAEAVAKQQQEARNKRYNDSIASVKQAQKQKDDNNPNYKDREFKYDDYYDYEYATRIKRFDNNINGLSYYDNYYTNSYWYNHNPYNYGVSVYNGYSWWGPSYNAYSYNPSVTFYSNYGWGSGAAFGYNNYDPFMSGYSLGYNNGFNNGYFGYPYSYGYNPYGYGYNPYGYGYNPYGYNPYGYGGGYGSNNGWGYYNSYDNNSGYTYAPRTSYGGGNSRKVSNPGVNNTGDSYVQKYVSEVAEKQETARKFSDMPSVRNTNSYTNPIRVDNNGRQLSNENPNVKPGFKDYPNTTNTPDKRDNATKYNDRNQTTPVRTYENGNTNQPSETQPLRQQPDRQVQQKQDVPQYNPPVRQYNDYQAPSTPNFPGNSGGGGGGGTIPASGGGHRPR